MAFVVRKSLIVAGFNEKKGSRKNRDPFFILVTLRFYGAATLASLREPVDSRTAHLISGPP